MRREPLFEQRLPPRSSAVQARVCLVSKQRRNVNVSGCSAQCDALLFCCELPRDACRPEELLRGLDFAGVGMAKAGREKQRWVSEANGDVR